MRLVPRTLSALAWLGMSLLYVLAWHGEVQRDSPIRDGSVTILWTLATVLNVALYVTSRNRSRPPFVIMWFLGTSVVCAFSLVATVLEMRSRSTFGEVPGLTPLVPALALLVASMLARRSDASSLASLIPRPSGRVVGALVVNLLASAVLDGVVLGIGVLVECAVALAFMVTALEQQSGGADLGLPHRGHDAHEMAA